jgi:dTDP-4-dehydrorhamnose 3,5-epimerase
MISQQNFQISKTAIEGVFIGQIQPKSDERGCFERLYCADEYLHLFGRNIVVKQINRSMSRIRGTVRGLHFQWPPMAETKIVSCPKGSLFDVAVDLRSRSPTYLQYVSAELSEDNKRFLVIPEGFAHGFQTLVPDTEILYLVSQYFSPSHDDGINPTDPAVGIKWPLAISLRSDKDAIRETIGERGFAGIKLTSQSF